MTGTDIAYFQSCCEKGLVRSPFLEVGSARVQGETPNLCSLARERGVSRVFGIDLAPGIGVDLAFDFSIPPEEFRQRWQYGTFATVTIFNVLEHTFDPVAILRNALHCMDSGGTLILVTPAIWPLHDYPGDYLRLMPHWYEAMASRLDLTLHREAFCWLSQFGIIKVDDLLVDGQYQVPSFLNSGRHRSPVRYWVSRYVHRVFNTFGRSHTFTHAAIGAACTKSPNTR